MGRTHAPPPVGRLSPACCLGSLVKYRWAAAPRPHDAETEANWPRRRKGAIAAACARGLCRSRGQGRQHAGHGPRRHARHARGKRPGDTMVDGRPRRTRWTAGGGENRRTSELVAPGGSGRACRSDGQQAGPGPAWWWGDRVMEVRAAPVSQCQPCLSAHRTLGSICHHGSTARTLRPYLFFFSI
ncbi:hypothetical protein PVAP13_2KG294367 [Panicum virgatum]|uniref:Uncharacterized protein n=1 Tax=Panicum virgatum TaxID=38727 RepID=A0A8T0WAX7_PANVG|nr:hypothetical protein PVAP13_2KG294367 [Panicum virgatum]